MRKISCCLMILCIFTFSMYTGIYAEGYEDEADPVQASIDDANNFLAEKVGIPNYYQKITDGKNINSILAVNGGLDFSNKPVYVYGSAASASAEVTTNSREFDIIGGMRIYRALGFACDGSAFPNPSFKPDNNGSNDENKKWVKNPWGESTTKELYDKHGNVYTRNISGIPFNYIKSWIKSNKFPPNYIQTATGKRNFFAARAVNPPTGIQNNFEDFLYIIQPPTEHAWGLGIAFYYWNGYNRLNYRSFLLKPFDLDVNDLSVQCNPNPECAPEGSEVLVGITAESSFADRLEDVPFKWTITKESGEAVPAAFSGHAGVQEGRISIDRNGERVFYARFVMPNEDVKIRFEINKAGDTPEEAILDNNTVEVTVMAESVTLGSADLDYNILSRKIKYPLSDTDITARLTLPRGSWDGNATGALNVVNQSTDLLRDFNVTNNPEVDEPNSTITRRPDIHATIYRKDFGDDPQNGSWLNLPTPWMPQTRTGTVSYSGTVTRPYKYYYTCGEEDCGGHVAYDSISASFRSGANIKTLGALIYNGKENITPKIYDNKIDSNSSSQLSKDLFWTSEPYDYGVIRWMYHMDEDDNLYDPTVVNGQYQRTFTQQCTAVTKWEKPRTMAQDYERSREAARDRDYRKSEYDKAVFASDRDFRSVDYPIKSGYYFNPTGTYTFTVETVTYKPTTADTRDHKDLVDAFIKAFHYESDLIYINSRKEAVNIQNQLLPRSSSSYARRKASLTAEDPTGVDDIVLLKVLDRSDDASRYSKVVEEIQHAQEVYGDTHEYWKDILEGYEESGTISSLDNYKYREYVKDGQRMYRITEKTTVTIEVNPDNRNIYTHAHMPNGSYTVKAWIGDIELDGMVSGYRRLGTLRGISTLDELEVSVKGSMYDDVN